MFEEEAKICLKFAQALGASYADARFMETRTRVASADPGFSVSESNASSFSVRVIVDGMWGFYGALGQISDSLCKQVVQRSVRIAKASAANSKGKVKLTSERTFQEDYQNSINRNPFEVSESDLKDLLVTSVRTLKEADGDAARNTSIKSGSCAVHMFDERKFLQTSDGAKISQKIIGCGALLVGSIQRDGRIYRRSYPRTLGPNFATRGFQHVTEADLPTNAKRIRSELFELSNAKRCPSEVTDLIIEGDLLAIQIHETIGHPTELDRATDVEWDFAGSTFLTPEKLDNFKFGAPHVNAVADATISGGPGSYAFDDEGVRAKKVDLIKDGMFVGYQSSRESAADLGLSESSGSMRAVNGANLPLIRMSNINLLPGDHTREEMIKETKKGILMTAPVMEIFDQRRRAFIFGAEIGWKIENGELSEVVSDSIYEGRTNEFWLNCDSIAKDGWVSVGSGCGKGRPHQTARVGHFCSQAKYKNVRVGVYSP